MVDRGKPTVWLLSADEDLGGLEAQLLADGVEVVRIDAAHLESAAVGAYDGRGLLLVDARAEAGLRALQSQTVAAVTTVALAAQGVPLPPGVLKLPADQDDEALSHHLREVLSEPANLRRHPRVRVSLPVGIDGETRLTLRDASLYGMWVEPAGGLTEGASVALSVEAEDGAHIALDGRVIAIRGEGAAVRCRPATDEDLLLWLHLILGGLVDSPLHAEVDPFGPLFD